MSGAIQQQFQEVWLVDFEFSAPAGERPSVVCMVAKELFSGKTLRCWEDELRAMPSAPFHVGDNALFVAYFASAEIGCFLSLNWGLPTHVLDLYAEFRCFTNGKAVPSGKSLVGALQFYGLPSIDVADKDAMRELAMRGGSYTEDEKQALLDYCESDVDALIQLLPAMEPKLDLPRALLRGKYMVTTAIMQHNGIPIDMVSYGALLDNWALLKTSLIDAVNPQYNVYEDQVFSTKRFQEYLIKHNIPWPVTAKGALELKDDTFKQMSVHYPELLPLKEVRATLSSLKLAKLEIGEDGRNRCILSPFAAKTGRNQPSTSKFIYGPAVWVRHLIKPENGWGVAYIDWSQQEFGIAAALSGDELMQKAYQSGDPYLEFAKQAGAAPEGATKATHPLERERFKACVLAVQYGMGAESLAQQAGISVTEARYLLELHRSTYRTFWAWSEDVVNYMGIHGQIHTVFGWMLAKGPNSNERSVRNFPMQANGAEMLRLACIYGVEAGVKLCAPIHDAILIEAPSEVFDEHIDLMQDAMVRASRDVLGGFELRSGVEKVHYPERYSDPRGEQVWGVVQDVLSRIACDAAA